MSKEAFKILFSFGVPAAWWWGAGAVLLVACAVAFWCLGWTRRALNWILVVLTGEYAAYILSATVLCRTVGERRWLVLWDFSKYTRLFVDNDCEAFYDTWMNVALYVPLGLLLMVCLRLIPRPSVLLRPSVMLNYRRHPELVSGSVRSRVAPGMTTVTPGMTTVTPGMRRIPRGRAYGLTVLAGFLLSLTVEVLQYVFILGCAETLDVVHNVLGCALGALPGLLLTCRKNSIFYE